MFEHWRVLSRLISVLFYLRTCMFSLSSVFGFCRSLWKHFRAVSLCLFLLVFPAYMAYMICQFFRMDFWLLIIISSSILTSLQVHTLHSNTNEQSLSQHIDTPAVSSFVNRWSGIVLNIIIIWLYYKYHFMVTRDAQYTLSVSFLMFF